MLPQVLAGLGALSILSAGCLFWLERLQPLFLFVAVAALASQVWLVTRRPPHRRTRAMLLILWTSIAVNAFILVAWAALLARYR